MALPRSLTKLYLRSSLLEDEPRQDWSCLAHLPTNLTSLSIQQYMYMNYEDLAHLNPRLSHLGIDLDLEIPITLSTLEKLPSRWVFWMSRYLKDKPNELVDQELARRNWKGDQLY